MDAIRRLIERLLGARKEPRIGLVGLQPELLRVESGTRAMGAVKVQAYDLRTGAALPDLPLLVTHLGGPLVIGGLTTEEAVLRTGPDGVLSLDPELGERGSAMLAVDHDDALTEPVFIELRSEGVVDQLHLRAPPCVTAGQGPVEGRITAVDFLGEPVEGARFDVTAKLYGGPAVTVEAEALGGGNYRFALELTMAGHYRVTVTDLDGGAQSAIDVDVRAGPAVAFVLGEVDPRASMPYGRLTLEVGLVDALDNLVDPARIRATGADGAPLEPARYTEDGAVFSLSSAGWAATSLGLSDAESELSTEVEILFAAAWLAHPGLVPVGSRFQTAAYLSPPPKERVHEAKVLLRFDAERVGFGGFEPRSLGEGTEVSVEQSDGECTVTVTSEEGFTSEEHPDGLCVGEFAWDCLEEGDSCFELTAQMSPETPPWEMCVLQKTLLDSCICVNVIHYQGHAGKAKRVKKLAEAFGDIISADDNVALCCPVLRVDVKTTSLSRKQWKKLRHKRDGLPRMKTEGDLGDLHDRLEEVAPDSIEGGCINIVIFPISDKSGFDGIMYKKGAHQGFGAVDDDDFTVRDNLVGHEIAHAFGISHLTKKEEKLRENKDNIMKVPRRSSSAGFGKHFNAAQCRQVFENLSRYPCGE